MPIASLVAASEQLGRGEQEPSIVLGALFEIGRNEFLGGIFIRQVHGDRHGFREHQVAIHQHGREQAARLVQRQPLV